MFFPTEIRSLQKLVNPDADVKKLLNQMEFDSLQSNIIDDHLFVPKTIRKLNVIRLKKVITPEFDLYKTMEQLLDSLQRGATIKIAFSFLVEDDSTLRYVFAIASRPFNEYTDVYTKKDKIKLLESLESLTLSEILHRSFEQARADMFSKSDGRPRKLVQATFWISRSL